VAIDHGHVGFFAERLSGGHATESAAKDDNARLSTKRHSNPFPAPNVRRRPIRYGPDISDSPLNKRSLLLVP